MSDQKLKTEQPKGADIYDLSGSTPTLGEVPHEQVQEAVLSGRFHLPTNKPVPVLSPDGELGEIPAEQAAAAFQQGYKYATPDQVKYGSKTATAAVLGAVDSATLGLAGAVLDPIAEAMGAPKGERLKIKEQNEGAYTAGQLAGILAPGGAGKIMQSAGEAGAAAVGLAAPTTALGRVGSMATKAAIENMVFASGDELAKKFMGDPQSSVETALINVGLAGALGGGIGGALGAVPELWRIGKESKLAGMLEGLKAKSEGLPALPPGLEAPNEIKAILSEAGLQRQLGTELAGSSSMSGTAIKQGLDNLENQITQESAKIFGKSVDDIAALDVSEHQVGEAIERTLKQEIRQTLAPIAEKLEADRKILEKISFTEPSLGVGATMAENAGKPSVQNLINKLSQMSAESAGAGNTAAAEYIEKIIPTIGNMPNAQQLRKFTQKIGNELSDGRNPLFGTIKDVHAALKTAEDEVFSIAAEGMGPEFSSNFRANLSSYRPFKESLRELGAYLGLKKAGGVGAETLIKGFEQGLDASTITARLSKASPELKNLLETKFPEVAKLVKNYEINSLLQASTKEGQLNFEALAKKIKNMDPVYRGKLLSAEQLSRFEALEKTFSKIPSSADVRASQSSLAKLWNKLPPSAVGMAAAVMGNNPITAFIATFVGKEAPDAVKRATLRFLASEAPTSAAAFKQAVGMASAVEKGERLLTRATKDVFEAKNGTAVKAPDVSKLKELVDDVVQDESKLLNVGADLGHYLPDQAAALGAATARNVRYLASLRPSTAPLSPLDGPRKVAQNEESDYNRALAIAQQPLIILDSVKQGRVTVKDLQHLNQLYPALAKDMQAKLQQEMMDAIAAGKNIPYATQMGLSAFVGMPLTTSLQPRAIRAAQPVSMPAPPQMGKPMRKSPGMSKLPQTSLTPGQSRARDRVQ